MEGHGVRFACFVPTQMELGRTARVFQIDRALEDGPLWVATGRLYGQPALLVRTGIGPENAARAAEHVLGSYAVREVLLVGFAGGTVPRLSSPSLIACKEVRDGRESEDRTDSVTAPKLLIDRALETGLVSDVLSAVTVPRVVASAKEKSTLGARFGVSLVEMEGFPLLRMARQRGVPGLMVRAVLDESNDELPEPTTWLSATGRFRARALFAYLVVRPRAVISLVKLIGRASHSRRCLNHFTEAYLRCASLSLSSSK
jgi:adenosylhomocysteine nucleosidase